VAALCRRPRRIFLASRPSWKAEEDEEATARLRKGESVGRPVGSDAFLAALEPRTRRPLHALKRGPKPKAARDEEERSNALSP